MLHKTMYWNNLWQVNLELLPQTAVKCDWHLTAVGHGIKIDKTKHIL